MTQRQRLGALARTHAFPLGILTVLHFCVFARSLLRDKDGVFYRYAPSDFDSSYHRLLIFFSDAVRHGSLPLWDPYMAAGLPHFINPQSQLWWPVTWLGSALGGYTHSMAQRQLFAIVLLGGVGVYVLSYRLWESRAAATFSAICYTFTTAVTGNMQHSDIINAFAHAPWLLWTISLFSRRPRLYLVMTPLLLFSLVVSGYPAVVFMLLAWGLCLQMYLWISVIPKESKLRMAIRACVAWAAGAGMSACHWLPIIVYASTVKRGTGLRLDEALSGGLSVRHFWGLLYSFTSNADLVGTYLDPSMRGLYVGALALPLVVIAIKHTNSLGNVKPVLVLCAGSALLSLGGDSFVRTALHVVLPLMNFSRFPAADSRALLALGIALLAGAGVVVVLRSGPDRAKLSKWCYVMAVGLVVSLPFLDRLLGAEATSQVFGDVVLGGTTAEICVLLLAGLVFSTAEKQMAALLIGLIALDLGTAITLNYARVGSAYTTAQGKDRAHSKHDFDPALADKPRTYIPGDISTPLAFSGHTSKEFYLNYYGGLALKEFQYLLDRDYTDWMHRGPRVVGGKNVVPGASIEQFQAATFPVEYKIKKYLPDRVEYEVYLTETATLVFNEVYFPGWKGYVDGAASDVVAASSSLRSIDNVPAGLHTITTVFRPKAFYAAAYFSLATAILYFSCLGVFLQRGRARGPRLARI